MIIAGGQSQGFYDLVQQALLSATPYATLSEFIAEAPKYWEDEKDWQKIFPLEDYENTQREFLQKRGNRYVPVLATYLSDDADTPVIANEGFTARTGEIPRMGNGVIFTAKSYYDETRFLDATIRNSKVANNLRVDVAKLLMGIQAQRSFTAYQVESQGCYISSKQNNNGGIERIKINFEPNADHKKEAGGFIVSGYTSKGTKNAWSVNTANPIGDLEDMFHYAWVNRILPRDASKSVFRMNGVTYNALKDHPTTRTKVAQWKTGYMVSDTNAVKYDVTDEELARFLGSKSLPKVEVVEYYGFSEYIDMADQTIGKNAIPAFAPNTVVLRPVGAYGSTQWSRIPNIFQTSNAPIYYTESGAIAVQEDVKSATQNGIKISANSLCIPVPYFIDSTLYLDVSQAAV